MKSNDMQSSELTLMIEPMPQDIYFLKNANKFRKVILNSNEQEEYLVSDDPIPESLSSWIELSILDNMNVFKLSCTWNGLTNKEEQAIKRLVDQVNAALASGTSLNIELNSVLDLSNWVLTFE